MGFCYSCGKQAMTLVHTSTQTLCEGCCSRDTNQPVAVWVARGTVFAA